ncbi:MAG TPA: hypothetical protein VGR37_17375 [Longimicrobiaceae bacterium]|nr:hypothetical protein [Longimicrobiaceae bacterium]
MSRVFVDDDLLTWEAYASGGRFGLPEHPRIVFHCLSDPAVRARFVVHEGDEADAEETVHEVPEDRLKEMLKGSRELD